MTRKKHSRSLNKSLGLTQPPRGTRPRGSKIWREQFGIVVDELERLGYEVEKSRGATDRLVIGSSVVEINSSTSPESMFYTLLHELGHVLVRRNWVSFTRLHPSYIEACVSTPTRRKESTQAYRVATLSEEIDAWRRGLEFARRKRLYVDVLKYESASSRALFTYVKWAVRGPEKGKRTSRAI